MEYNKLNFYNTIELIHCAVKNGILQLDPRNKDNILIYRSAGTESSEGWYSQNIHDVASELFHDPECEGQKVIMEALKEKNITVEFTDTKKLFDF